MKRAVLTLLLSVFTVAAFAQNKIKDFEVNNEKLLPEFRFAGNKKSGKLSQFVEDKTWNRCLKLEMLDYNRDPKTNKRSVLLYVTVGGDKKRPGFLCKPNTKYNFSFEARGKRSLVILDYSEWDKNGKVKRYPTSIIRFKPQKEWTLYKGTFKTSASAKRVALRFLFWGNERHISAMGNIGDYLLIDKIVIEEAQAGLFDQKKTAMPEMPLKGPKVYVASSDGQSKSATGFEQLKSPVPAKVQTSFKINAGKDALIVNVKCPEPAMAALKGNVKNDSMATKIWRDDLIEIFFDAVKSDRILNQFVVSAGGGRWMGNGAKAINKFDAWTAKVIKGTKEWTAEVKIPYKTLGFDNPPKKGDIIKFNICRQRPGAKELSTFSFSDGNFHNKKNWSILVIGSIAPYVKKELDLVKKEATNPEIAKLIKSINPDNPARAYAEIQRLKKAVRMAKLSKSKFIVAQMAATSVDPAIPFLPDALGKQTEIFKVKAAVNEYAPLVLALANMTGKFEEYRVRLIRGFGYENSASFFVSGQEGLKDKDGNIFPMDKIELRRGVQSKDSDAKTHGRRYDILAALNQVSTIPVPAHSGSLIWITFDCRDVKPGLYKGFLNIIPLSERCEGLKWSKDRKSFDAEGESKRIPVELEVLPIELAKESPMPVWFFNDANNPTTFDFMRKYDMAFFHLTPWWFSFKFNKDGSIADYRTQKQLLPLLKMQRDAMRKSRMKSNPKFAVAFSAYPVFKRIHIGRSNKQIKFNSPEYWKAWRNWIQGVDKIMTDNGIARGEYIIEAFDEPQYKTPEAQAESIRAFAEAKKAVPGVQLAVTNGHPTDSGFEELAKYVDYYYFGQHHIVKPPQDGWSQRLKKMPGKRIGVYACGTNLRQDPYRYYRRMPWLALRYNMDSVGLFSFINHGNGYGAGDFYLTPHGGLAYVAGDRDPVPSIRLEAFRVGMTDIKYMKLLEKLASESTDKQLKSEARKLLATAPYDVEVKYPHEKDKADKVRSQAIELILKLQKAKSLPIR